MIEYRHSFPFDPKDVARVFDSFDVAVAEGFQKHGIDKRLAETAKKIIGQEVSLIRWNNIAVRSIRSSGTQPLLVHGFATIAQTPHHTSRRLPWRYVYRKGTAGMDIIKNPDVAEVFNNYPEHIRRKMVFLRQLILDTAAETERVSTVNETLKWGEPSYRAKGGSTIRMDWKSSKPDQYFMYFHCKTRLVDTFKELYRDKLKFEGNRAIVFNEDDEVPVDELIHCISLSLTYHRRKHLPMLGV